MASLDGYEGARTNGLKEDTESDRRSIDCVDGVCSCTLRLKLMFHSRWLREAYRELLRASTPVRSMYPIRFRVK